MLTTFVTVCKTIGTFVLEVIKTLIVDTIVSVILTPAFDSVNMIRKLPVF